MLAIKRDRRMQQVVMFFASFVLKGGRFLGLTTSQFSCPNLGGSQDTLVLYCIHKVINLPNPFEKLQSTFLHQS